MSWKHWTAVLAVIGFGIVLQIPRNDEPGLEEHPHPAASATASGSDSAAPAPEKAEPAGPYRTIALEVTGMT